MDCPDSWSLMALSDHVIAKHWESEAEHRQESAVEFQPPECCALLYR